MILERPKSVSLTCPSFDMSRLSGFRSLAEETDTYKQINLPFVIVVNIAELQTFMHIRL